MELLFLNVSEWVSGGVFVVVAGIVVTIFRKKGIDLKFIFGKASAVTKEIGEAFLASSDALSLADKAIKENGKLKENSVKEVLAAGKNAVLEWKDVIVVIKKKS